MRTGRPGNELQALRLARGLSLSALARATGIAPRTLRDLEHPDIRPKPRRLTPYYAERLAPVLGSEIWSLVEEQAPHSARSNATPKDTDWQPADDTECAGVTEVRAEKSPLARLQPARRRDDADLVAPPRRTPWGPKTDLCPQYRQKPLQGCAVAASG